MLALAYYGPNSGVIGNIGNGYWHFTPIEEIKQPIFQLLIFIAVDIVGTAICTLLMWTRCKVNLPRVYAYLQKEFWMLMSVDMAHVFTAVGYHYIILLCFIR